MGSLGGGKVHTDSASMKKQPIQLLDAELGVLDGTHGDEAKTARTVGLISVQPSPPFDRRSLAHPLIVHDDHLLDFAKPAKLIFEVTLTGAHAQAENAQDVGGLHASGRMPRTGGRRVESLSDTIVASRSSASNSRPQDGRGRPGDGDVRVGGNDFLEGHCRL